MVSIRFVTQVSTSGGCPMARLPSRTPWSVRAHNVLGLPQHGYQAVQGSGQPPDVWSVAIVGMGPRGLSVLERLLITISVRPPERPVVIWAIDPVQHGPGRVWRTDQPRYLTVKATAGGGTGPAPDKEPLGRGGGKAARAGA